MANCIQCGRRLPALTLGRKVCGWCKQHEAAQRGEDVDYQPVMAAPWNRSRSSSMLVTQLIFGINAAVFIGMVLSGASPLGPSSASLLAWGANSATFTLTGQWWRLLSSCFVHVGIIHIALNMWCLWSLGELAEHLYGHFTFLGIYLLCGVSGSLASVFWHSHPTVSAGASGAIFGIAGALIGSIKLGEFNYGSIAHGVMRSLLAFVGYNVLFGLFTGITDNACHIGGLLAGLLLGALVARLAPQPQLFPRLLVLLTVAALLFGGGYALQKSRAPRYYFARAQVEAANGKIDSAISLFEAAASANPRLAKPVAWQVSQLKLQQNDLPGAEQELKRLGMSDEEAFYTLGSTALDDHHPEQALTEFQKLSARDPHSTQAHWAHAAIGESLIQLNRYDEAIAELKKQIELFGDDIRSERLLAEAYEAKGMKAESEAARKAAESMGDEQ
jgi:membrane associated rhomboid family serine protease